MPQLNDGNAPTPGGKGSSYEVGLFSPGGREPNCLPLLNTLLLMVQERGKVASVLQTGATSQRG